MPRFNCQRCGVDYDYMDPRFANNRIKPTAQLCGDCNNAKYNNQNDQMQQEFNRQRADAAIGAMKDMAMRTCQWCAKKYDYKDSNAYSEDRYCSRRCEVEAR